MSEINAKKKELNLYDIINLDIYQKFYPKKKKEYSMMNLTKEE